VPGQILAIGGFSLGTRFDDLVLELSGPRVCYIPTASACPEIGLGSFYESFAGRAEPSHVLFDPGLAPTCASMYSHKTHLRLRREHGQRARDLACPRLRRGAPRGMGAWCASLRLERMDDLLVRGRRHGLVRPRARAGMRDGLGFLPESACPHYDGEERRRPVYRALVDEGFPPGYAADDGAALHFVGTDLAEVVSAAPGARAYRVEPGRETPSSLACCETLDERFP
jgi:dipeptidase E